MFQTHRRRIFPFEPVAFMLVLLAGLLAAGCSKGPQEAPQPPVVEVMPVIQKDVPIYHEWVGTLDGTVNATIRSRAFQSRDSSAAARTNPLVSASPP